MTLVEKIVMVLFQFIAFMLVLIGCLVVVPMLLVFCVVVCFSAAIIELKSIFRNVENLDNED